MGVGQGVQEANSLTATGIGGKNPGGTRSMAFVLLLFASGIHGGINGHFASFHYPEPPCVVIEAVKVQRSIRTCQVFQNDGRARPRI